MEENEEKHENILKSLRKTTEEKAEAVRLFMEINERISEREMPCKQQLTDNLEGCKTCLQQSCITFYISNCSQEIKPLPVKMFQDRDEEEDDLLKSYNEEEDHLPQAESSFHQLLSDIRTLFNQGLVFFRNIQQELDQSFQRTFMSGVNLADPETHTTMPNNPVIIVDSVHWDLSTWIQYLLDFSKAIIQGIADAFYSIFNHLHQDSKLLASPMEGTASHFRDSLKQNQMECRELHNSSGCLQYQGKCQLCYEAFLKDCPDVLQLYSKSEEVFKLVGIAEQQYQDLTHILHQHAEDTSTLMSLMKESFGWVAEHNNMPIGTHNIFSIEKLEWLPPWIHSSLCI
ncbi:hypothetical protein XENTR_v10016845 [Xenopus tropicalis]|nr:hypothetical protein XENTR_v10016845 [Xenopus tropicalis]